ncbi:hypothetical protein LCGC14_1862300 [marine sediment metagenome]|uniref:Uncharacterized protein n=1 Tax=marine sediment metagenome TaxID=412755 RepID=A0A0F9GVJ1_9ZZZZ
MPINRTPPSGREARRLEIELRKTWGNAFTRDQRMRDLINRKNKVELLPETLDLNVEPVELHTGRSGSLLDHAQTFVGSLPSLTIEAEDLSTMERREAEQTERAFKALFFKQLVATGFWSNAGRGSLLTGRTVLTCLPLPSVWTTQEGFPVRQKGQRAQAYINEVNQWKRDSGKEPIIIQSIPSDRILLKLDSNDKVLAALETKAVSADLVANALGSERIAALLAEKRLQWYDQLEVLQYIDDIFVCYYLVSDQPLRPEMSRNYHQPQGYKRLASWQHGLGKCPVVFVPGVKTDEQEYEFRFKPFLADAEEDLYIYDFLMSRLATMVKAYYFPSFIWTLSSNANEQQGGDRPEENINIGGTTTKYSDEDIEPLRMPDNLPDATLLQQQLDELIQRNTLEDVLFGKVQGDTAAFAIRLRINVAKQALVPTVKHLAIGLTEVFDLVTRAVEHLGEEVIIDGEEVTPAMAIAARGRISVSVDPRLPGEEGIDLQKAAMATNLRLPEPWIWETILGIDDPATLSLLRDVQELEELPEVKERLLREALELLQVRIEDEETMAILDVLDQFGDQLDPEVVAALQALATGQTAGEAGAPPPPPGGLGRGPFPEEASNQAVGGGRGLGTVNAPTPSNIETGEAGVGSEERPA